MEKKQLALKLPQRQSRQSSLATPPTLGRNTSRELLDLRSFPKMYQKTVSITTTPRPQRAATAPIISTLGGHQGRSLLLPQQQLGHSRRAQLRRYLSQISLRPEGPG